MVEKESLDTFVEEEPNFTWVVDKKTYSSFTKSLIGFSGLSVKGDLFLEQYQGLELIFQKHPRINLEEVNKDKQKVRVTISIFGRPTPVELDFFQLEMVS